VSFRQSARFLLSENVNINDAFETSKIYIYHKQYIFKLVGCRVVSTTGMDFGDYPPEFNLLKKLLGNAFRISNERGSVLNEHSREHAKL